MIERCKFVLDNPDIIAAKYCTVVYGMFLYGQAVKDNFELPINLPDGFTIGLEQYLSDNSEFSEKIIRQAPKVDKYISAVLYQAVLKNDFEAAALIFKDALNNPNSEVETITGMVDMVFGSCKVGTKTEILKKMRRAKDWFLPILKQHDNREYWAYVAKAREEVSAFCRHLEYCLQKEQSKEQKWVELERLMELMEDIIRRMKHKSEWFPFNSSTPRFITYDFVYSNGKNGDIDMFIASNYGQLQKLDEVHYSVELATVHKDEILLLEYIYTHSLHNDI